jgi:GAF domain-containing protein
VGTSYFQDARELFRPKQLEAVFLFVTSSPYAGPKAPCGLIVETMRVAPSTQELAHELERLAEAAPTAEHLMTSIVCRLAETLPKYNWVGFYMLEPCSPGEPKALALGPYVGAPTPHTRIPLDQGICGAAAASGRTLVVDDVRSDPRYLACSLETKSEIVAPIFVKGEVAGELDIDSHLPAAFGPDDRSLVEHCARLVGRFLEKTSA